MASINPQQSGLASAGLASAGPPVDIFICTSCQGTDSAAAIRPGAQLLQAVRDLSPDARFRLVAADCLSVCKRVCTIAVSQPGKWTYVIGDLDPANDAGAVIDYAAAYAAHPAGTPPLKERPAAIRRGAIARIPPSPAQDRP